VSEHEPVSSPLVVDVWANHWDRDFFSAYPPMRALYDRLGMSARAGMSADDLVREAAASGISRVVLSATDFPGSPATNDVLAPLIVRHGSTLIGCASVDPFRGMEGVRALRRAVSEQGFRALKILPFVYDEPPDAAVYFPLYAACVDLGIPVLILTGHTAVKRRSSVGRPLHLDDVALHFPELTIVAGHAGFPWTDELLSLAWKHENVFIDTSGHRPKYLPPALLHFMNSYGRDKVLFGTGYPFMTYEQAMADIRGMDLREESRGKFLGGNAARIWRLS